MLSKNNKLNIVPLVKAKERFLKSRKTEKGTNVKIYVGNVTEKDLLTLIRQKLQD